MASPVFDETQPFTPGDMGKTAFDETQPFTIPGQSPSALQTGLGVLGKGLDYQRGLVGAPIEAGLLSKFTGKDIQSLMKPNEYQAGMNPTTTTRAPNADTMMARAGIPQGPHASDVAPWAYQNPAEQATWSNWNPMKYAPSKGGMLDVTPRGVAGGALDIVTDPLTYESGGISKLAELAKGEASPTLQKLSALFNPASNATEALGVHNYEKGLAPMISKGEQYGKDVADTYYNQGIRGKSSTISEMGDQAAENLKVQRDQLMDTAQKAGAAPSTSAAFQPLVDHVQQLVSDGRLSIEDAKKIVSTYSERMGTVPNPTVQQMSQWKSDISNSLPASVYDVTKNTPMAKNMGKIAAGGNRDEVARAMNAALPGSGEELNDANEQLGNLLTVQNVADKQAARELNKKLIQPQDIGHAAIAGAAAGKPEVGMGTLLGRIAAGTINSPGFRTTTGYGLRKLGTGTVTAPVLDAATFNALKQMANQQPTAGVGK